MKLGGTSRLYIIAGLVIFAGLLLVMQLYNVQVVKGEEYTAQADRQYVRPDSDIFDRGTIYFTAVDGTAHVAAGVSRGYRLIINPNKLAEPADAFNALSGIIEINEEDFLERAERDDTYVILAHRLNREQADRVQSLELSGISIEQEQWRNYPAGSLAAQTIGFVAYNEDSLEGRYGLERYYQDELRRDDAGLFVNFFAELFANAQQAIASRGYSGNGELILTIEPTVQGYLEKQLASVSKTWGSKLTGGVIIDPKTGAIYALAVNPTFDLNDFQSAQSPSLYRNPIVEDVYEMGSIIKPLTMSAGIDAGAVTPETKYYDHGFIELDTKRISNYDGKGRGWSTMQTVLSESLNTGVAFVVGEMGNNKFAQYMKKFGIGEETGIDLPGEQRGIIDNLDSPRDIEYATASFGQGIATTPIATVRALSTIANGGHLITPHVVKQLNHENGLSKKIFYDPGEQVISEETSRTITRMLVRVVDEALAGGDVALQNYSVAAKTGTAQIPDPSGGYYTDRYLHSFFGYFPAFDPRFLVFMFTLEPHGVRYASQTLTTPFMDTTNFLINYYSIPPDR